VSLCAIELSEIERTFSRATLVSGATLTSDAGVVVSATWGASPLASADGSAVELRVMGHGRAAAPRTSASSRGAVEWNAKLARTGVASESQRLRPGRRKRRNLPRDHPAGYVAAEPQYTPGSHEPSELNHRRSTYSG
jgi:hypothetical protein